MTMPSDEEMVEEVVRALHWRAKAAMDRSDFPQAEAIYREWMGYLPWDPRPKFALAQLLLARGEYSEGFELYEARTELNLKPAKS